MPPSPRPERKHSGKGILRKNLQSISDPGLVLEAERAQHSPGEAGEGQPESTMGNARPSCWLRTPSLHPRPRYVQWAGPSGFVAVTVSFPRKHAGWKLGSRGMQPGESNVAAAKGMARVRARPGVARTQVPGPGKSLPQLIKPLLHSLSPGAFFSPLVFHQQILSLSTGLLQGFLTYSFPSGCVCCPPQETQGLFVMQLRTEFTAPLGSFPPVQDSLFRT